MAEYALLIGGPFDGEKRTVENGRVYIIGHSRGRFIPFPGPTDVPIELKQHTYQRIGSPVDNVALYLYEGTKDRSRFSSYETLMQALIEGYRNPKLLEEHWDDKP